MNNTNFKTGDKLKCHWEDKPGIYLTKNKIYMAITDQEPGIFETDPYITVISDSGKPFKCYAARFTEDSNE